MYNNYYRHIKASSPRFNSIIIIGCLMLYLVPVFNAVSLSGNHFDMQKLIPSSCEVQYYCIIIIVYMYSEYCCVQGYKVASRNWIHHNNGNHGGT